MTTAPVQLMRRQHYTEEATGIDFTAIMDIAFVVIILFFAASFYLVESNREEVGEPSYVEAEPLGPPIRVAIDATGLISIEGRPYERALVVENLRRLSSKRPDAALHIDVHPDAGSDSLVMLVDAARALGIESVDVQTGEES